MKEPFANLNTNTIDNQIEQMLQTIPEQQDDQDSSCLRDLQYLYRKEEILARAQQRLMIASLPEYSGDQKAATSTAWRERSTTLSRPQKPAAHNPFSWPKIVAVLAAALLLLGVIIGTTSFLSTRPQQTSGASHQSNRKTIQITPASTIVFSDPLTQNIHNFQVDSQHFFKDGAYHILNKSQGSVALVVNQSFTQPTLAYSLTMQEVAGDNAEVTNTFGLVLRYNLSATGVETFYTFEIRNQGESSQYSFYKYDSSKVSPWATILPTNVASPLKAGKEFHSGQGKNAVNTVKVVMNGNSFTFYVNGQQVAAAKDSSYTAGSMGMIVNLKGTEVAFSDMLITQP
jgi:hypothetical protein